MFPRKVLLNRPPPRGLPLKQCLVSTRQSPKHIRQWGREGQPTLPWGPALGRCRRRGLQNPLDRGGQTHLEGDLGQEDELVPLEEPAGRVHVDGVGDLVRQIDHSLPDLLGGGCPLDGLLEHHVESLGRGARRLAQLDPEAAPRCLPGLCGRQGPLAPEPGRGAAP